MGTWCRSTCSQYIGLKYGECSQLCFAVCVRGDSLPSFSIRRCSPLSWCTSLPSFWPPTQKKSAFPWHEFRFHPLGHSYFFAQFFISSEQTSVPCMDEGGRKQTNCNDIPIISTLLNFQKPNQWLCRLEASYQVQVYFWNHFCVYSVQNHYSTS